MFNTFDTKIDTNMATLKFYLQPQNKKNRYPVMMVYQEKGKKFRFYTRVTIKKENWVKNSFKPISLEDFENKEKLTVCQSVISEIEREALQQKRSLSVEEMAFEFRERIKRTDAFNELGTIKNNESIVETQSQFFVHFDEFVEQSRATKAIVDITLKVYHHYGTKFTTRREMLMVV